MDGWQGAVQGHGCSQFGQGHIRLAFQQLAHLALVGSQDARLAPGETMAGSDVTGESALSQELFDQTQRDAVVAGDLFPCSFPIVVRRHNSFTQIQRDRSHARILTTPSKTATVLFNLL